MAGNATTYAFRCLLTMNSPVFARLWLLHVACDSAVMAGSISLCFTVGAWMGRALEDPKSKRLNVTIDFA